MSATPIPAHAGLLMYGDLDISVLDESAPRPQAGQDLVHHGKSGGTCTASSDKQIEAGHQVYIVCPAIEENGGLAACRP